MVSLSEPKNTQISKHSSSMDAMALSEELACKQASNLRYVYNPLTLKLDDIKLHVELPKSHEARSSILASLEKCGVNCGLHGRYDLLDAYVMIETEKGKGKSKKMAYEIGPDCPEYNEIEINRQGIERLIKAGVRDKEGILETIGAHLKLIERKPKTHVERALADNQTISGPNF